MGVLLVPPDLLAFCSGAGRELGRPWLSLGRPLLLHASFLPVLYGSPALCGTSLRGPKFLDVLFSFLSLLIAIFGGFLCV